MVVCSRPAETLPGEVRAQWLRETFPGWKFTTQRRIPRIRPRRRSLGGRLAHCRPGARGSAVRLREPWCRHGPLLGDGVFAGRCRKAGVSGFPADPTPGAAGQLGMGSFRPRGLGLRYGWPLSVRSPAARPSWRASWPRSFIRYGAGISARVDHRAGPRAQPVGDARDRWGASRIHRGSGPAGPPDPDQRYRRPHHQLLAPRTVRCARPGDCRVCRAPTLGSDSALGGGCVEPGWNPRPSGLGAAAGFRGAARDGTAPARSAIGSLLAERP